MAECVNRGLVAGGPHLYIGEEAVAVGVCAALRRTDYITSTHRGHGHCIAKGGEMKPMLAELFAKATGYCKGKGGSMHIADVEPGHPGRERHRRRRLPDRRRRGAGRGHAGRATGWRPAFFGDGATNTGSFHEAMNLASIWKLPVVLRVREQPLRHVHRRMPSSTPIEDICAARASPTASPASWSTATTSLAVYETARGGRGTGAGRRRPDADRVQDLSAHGPLRRATTQRYRDPAEDRARGRSTTRSRASADAASTAACSSEAADRQIMAEIEREVEEAIEFAVEQPGAGPVRAD